MCQVREGKGKGETRLESETDLMWLVACFQIGDYHRMRLGTHGVSGLSGCAACVGWRVGDCRKRKTGQTGLRKFSMGGLTGLLLHILQ